MKWIRSSPRFLSCREHNQFIFAWAGYGHGQDPTDVPIRVGPGANILGEDRGGDSEQVDLSPPRVEVESGGHQE